MRVEIVGSGSVRRASVDDAPVLARLLWDFCTEFGTEVDPVDVLAGRFARLLGLDDVVALLVGVHGVDPAGFALTVLRPAIWFDGPVAHLDELYVVPDRRGGGLGTSLLLESMRIADGRGAPEMHINVDEVDVDTRRFYERHGFVNVEAGADGRMLCHVGPTA